MQMMQRFTQAVKLNLTLRPNYNMTEIKQNNGANKTKLTCTMKKKSCMLIGTRRSTQHSQELDIYIDDITIKNVTKLDFLCFSH